MKKKESALYELIHALTAAEKKSIRLNISKFHPDQSNKKLLLFDVLNRSKQYQPEAERAAYQEAGYSTAYLAADYHLLYDLVLTLLSDFYTEHSATAAILDDLRKAHILFEKKLFQQALQQLRKTEKQAERYEVWGVLIETMKLEQRCLRVLGQIDEAYALIDAQENVWQRQQQLNRLTQLHYRSAQLRTQLAKARDEQQVAAFRQLMQDPLLQSEANLQGFFEQFHYWETHCNYTFVTDDKPAELRCNQRLIELLDRYDHIRKDQPLNDLVIRTRILAIERNLYPERFLDLLANYRRLADGLSKQKPEAESIIFIFSYNYELDKYISDKHWDKALQILPEMQQKLKKYQSQVGKEFQLTCYYRFACTYFFNRHYQEAADSISMVLSDFDYALRPDVHHVSLLVQIIIHYELNNRKLIPHLIQTAKYHLEKHAALYQTEHLFLSFLKKLVRKSAKNEIHALLQLQAAFRTLLEEHPTEKRVLAIFDLEAWIEDKLKRLQA